MTEKILNKLNYNINYTKNSGCILINPKDWESNDTSKVQGYTVDGTLAMNYLTKVLKTNIEEEVYGTPLSEGDLVLLTKTASKVSYLKPFKIPIGINNKHFSNVHILQVIGKFKDGIMDIDNLEPLFDKVIMEEIKVPINSTIYAGEPDVASVGKVIKVGDGGFTRKWKRRDMEVKVGDIVLLRDNITTKVNLSDKEYICTEDSMIVGRFENGNIDMNNLHMFHEGILMEEKQEEKAMDSSILLSPTINLDEEDISEVYQRDRFKVISKNNKILYVDCGDTVIVNRDCTNYVNFKGKKYYIVNGIKNIEGKIIK